MTNIQYVDLQVNGYAGVDFNSPNLTEAGVRKAAEAMRFDGVRWALPTVITASPEDMSYCIRTLVSAVENQPDVADIFAGIHIEGPFLSRHAGFIGAHPPAHAKDADIDLMSRLLDVGAGHVRLVTLAPEVDVAGRLTRFCVRQGVRVAAGHTDATVNQLECCIDEGLSLFTHLGNGCPQLLNRHDNILLRALSFADRISYSLIADSFHVPAMLFSLLLRWIPTEHLVVVSDAISATSLGPGVYQLGEREVQIGSDKAARDASGEHFVGAASSMADAEHWLRTTLQLGEDDLRILLSTNAMRWLNQASLGDGT